MLKHFESIDNVGLEMTLHHGSRQPRHQPSAVESCEQLQNISESRSVDHHVVLIMNDALQYRTAYNARHGCLDILQAQSCCVNVLKLLTSKDII